MTRQFAKSKRRGRGDSADDAGPIAGSGALRRGLEAALAGVVLLGTLVLVIAPIGYVFFGALQSQPPGAPDSVFTFDNILTAYTSPSYLLALFNTLGLATTVAVLSILCGGALAWIIARTDAPWRRPLALLLVVPLMISTLVTTLAWIALAAPNAEFINALSRAWFGVRTVFDIYSFAGIVLVHVLHYSAFAFLSFFAALRSIDASLEEASAMLGAGPLRTAWRMTLPLIFSIDRDDVSGHFRFCLREFFRADIARHADRIPDAAVADLFRHWRSHRRIRRSRPQPARCCCGSRCSVRCGSGASRRAPIAM